MKVTRMGLILGLGRSPGEGNGNPLQYSCLKNSMKRGGWWATVCAWAKNQTWARCYITTVSTYVSILHGWITSHHQFCGFNTAPTCNLGASHVDERSGYTHTHIRVYQSYSTLGSPKDCSPLGSSVHGILQARILEWVTIPFSRGSSQPRDQTQTQVSCIAGRLLRLLSEPPGKYILPEK